MTTVFRLPEEPPVTTTVESVAEPKRRYKHIAAEESTWQLGTSRYLCWGAVLDENPSGVVVVEPDPHPTPWRIDDWFGDHATIFDAKGSTAAYVECDDRDVAQRIVDAVNKAANT